MEPLDLPEALRQRAARLSRVVFFTGAGISKESGLDTFRGTGGLWESMRPEELATYAFDDEGTAARKVFLIRQGVLLAPLGGEGVANARASGWNRPPIHRMANLNLEPGTSSLEEMIGSIERGVLMRTNVSWSIDDSRNKFQFGCEWGERIEGGRRRGVVKNPNYRGVSATFWRTSLSVYSGP